MFNVESTLNICGRGDHEVHKGHVVALAQKNSKPEYASIL
jgi:hypothetical protein